MKSIRITIDAEIDEDDFDDLDDVRDVVDVQLAHKGIDALSVGVEEAE